jgi:hypothetical protein
VMLLDILDMASGESVHCPDTMNNCTTASASMADCKLAFHVVVDMRSTSFQ